MTERAINERRSEMNHERRLMMKILVLVAVLVMVSEHAMARDRDPAFTTDFQLENCTFASRGDNPFFILRGGRLVLEGEEDGDVERVEITVTNDLESITIPEVGTVLARVVMERETLNGELVEVSRNFFAVCQETNDVFYFGEDVDIYHEDGSITHDGAWRAGEPAAAGVAEAGIIMPGRFLLGARYFQEIADGMALDRAEHVEMGLDVTTPAGEFHDCVKIVETSPLEPRHASIKFYCPGVGLVIDSGNELIEYERD